MRKPNKYTSIVMTHFGGSQARVDMMKKSLESLIATTGGLPVEIIIVDNPGEIDSSEYFLDLLKSKKIVSYTRNAENMHFGFARNQGIDMAKGNYICIVDDDIGYRDNWLDRCLEILEAYPNEKIYSTPIKYPGGLSKRYHKGTLDLNGQTYNLNLRAGSNCFVMRRDDFFEVGRFLHHRVAGSKWTDRASRLHFSAAVTPVNMIDHLGHKGGYNQKQTIPIKRTLTNGKEVYYNCDEHPIPV